VLLPTVGRADSATTRELNGVRLDLRVELAERVTDQTRSLVPVFIVSDPTILLMVAGLIFGAGRIA
jgi:hypothetical protein